MYRCRRWSKYTELEIGLRKFFSLRVLLLELVRGSTLEVAMKFHSESSSDILCSSNNVFYCMNFEILLTVLMTNAHLKPTFEGKAQNCN